MVSHQGAFSLGLSLTRVAFHQGFLLRAVFHLGGLLKVVFQ